MFDFPAFEFDPIYMVWLLVAISAGLTVEAVYLTCFSAASYRSRINRRLMLGKDRSDRESVLIELRRERGLTDLDLQDALSPGQVCTTVGTTKAHPTPTRASARPATAGPASVPPLISEAVARLAAAASAVVSASRTTKAPCSGRTAAAISESRAVNVSTTPTGAPPRTAARVAADATQRAPMPMPRCS